MFSVCAAAVWAMLANGLMTMNGYVILNVTAGAMALLCVMMLCLAYSMDRAAKDESSVLFYLLLVITYFGILSDNFSWFVDGNTELVWANYPDGAQHRKSGTGKKDRRAEPRPYGEADTDHDVADTAAFYIQHSRLDKLAL